MSAGAAAAPAIVSVLHYVRCRSQTTAGRGSFTTLCAKRISLAAQSLRVCNDPALILHQLLQDHHADVLEAAEAQPLASTNPAAASATNSRDTKQRTGIYYADKALLGLGLYAVSSVFLATMLICAKTLSKRGFPTWQNLLCRSLSIMAVALVICAKQRVNPFGNRSVYLVAANGVHAWPSHYVCTYVCPLTVPLHMLISIVCHNRASQAAFLHMVYTAI